MKVSPSESLRARNARICRPQGIFLRLIGWSAWLLLVWAAADAITG